MKASGIPANKQFVNLTGEVYGRWTVESYAVKRGEKHCWNCLCECGARKVVRGNNLRNGNSKSCGCLQKAYVTEHRTIHGKSGKPEYNSYTHMKSRCYNKKDKNYADYGGRGITVCSRWRNSAEYFFEDMGDKPSAQHSLDRIDNDGNYEPDNCRWATSLEQSLNQRMRRDNSSGVPGVHWSRASGKWLARARVNGKRAYLGVFADKKEAIAACKQAENQRKRRVP